jgi:RNA polymerase sigma-70 factor (ECF subfamily)
VFEVIGDERSDRMTTRDDIENMILRVSLGDRDAFSSLYDATSAKLFGVCLHVLKNRAEAEDTLQDVFVRVWQKAKLYKVNGYSPMTWLITLARNAAIDRLRARRVNVQIDEVHDLSDASPTPEADAIAASEKERLTSCLNALEADKSAAVRQAYLEGDSYKELAARYNVPLNTMRTWLRRSLLKLRECLADD